MAKREPWFLALERAEFRKSGSLGDPMDPLADVFGDGPGLLDELSHSRPLEVLT